MLFYPKPILQNASFLNPLPFAYLFFFSKTHKYKAE